MTPNVIRAAIPRAQSRPVRRASPSPPMPKTPRAPAIATAPTPPRRAPAGCRRSSRRSASAAKARSFELPIAISTLRTKRSRPMRLTGDLANSARNAASSSRASSARRWRAQFVARGEFCLVPGLRELVPGAHREAIVAAIDAVADGFAKFARDRALVLDGEIGDAAPRIELVGRGKRRRGADVEAGPARAAMVGLGLVLRQIEGREDRAEKQPRAELPRNEVGVLALPAQSRRLRQRLFHHRGGIDEYLDLAAGRGDQPSRQRLQPLLDQVVIIVALRIDRDRAARPRLQNSQRILIGPVIHAQHDDRAHVGPQRARIGAALRMRGEPVHVAMRAGREEIAKVPAGISEHAGSGDADAIESQRAGFACERGFQVGGSERCVRAQKSRST